MFKIICGVLMAIMPVNAGMAPQHHKPPHFHCITKGAHHPEICVPKHWHPHH